MKHVYLDTSRIRYLAHNRNAAFWNDIDCLLRSGNYSLVLSYWHLFEFSRGSLTGDVTAEYLDTLPSIKWAIQNYDMWREEVAAALELILTNKEDNDIQVFKDSFIDILKADEKRRLQYDLQQFTIVRLLEVCKRTRMSAPFDQKLQQDINMIMRLKEDAAVWRDWRTVLRSHIRAYWPEQTRAGLNIEPDDDLIAAVAEAAEDSVPSLTFATQLQRIKFDSSESVEPNDLYDEYHAAYAPYCNAIMHDEDTCRRVEETGSPYASRFASIAREFLRSLSSE